MSKSKGKKVKKLVAREHMMEMSKNKSPREIMLEKIISRMKGKKYIGRR